MSPFLRRLLLPAGVVVVLALALVGLLAADGSDGDSGDAEGEAGQAQAVAASEVDPSVVEPGAPREFGPAPEFPDGPWDDETTELLDLVITTFATGLTPRPQLDQIGQSEDPRLAWPLADLLRFIGPGDGNDALVQATQRLLPEAVIEPFSPWGSTVDQLIAWDVPAPEQYADFKRNLYGEIEPKWAELFTEEADIDWRLVGWGGVGIDDREFGSTAPCSCIPALDEPAVTPADQGGWYPDDALVFGVVIDGEARAYPKNIMEVHEMVNDTLGGRTIALPYCTLCGSAQAYLTDQLPAELDEAYGRPVMRTSGLLIRSNKMMFERESRSLIDTFTGEATSGPLAEAGVTFEQVSVVTSTWEAWREAHPGTTIIAEDGGLGRAYDLDPLRGRDDDGPIFPIGDVDPRLPVQEPVLGLIDADGQPIAVHVAAATSVLAGGQGRIEIGEFELRLDGSGVRALRDGEDAGGHQAFWFAWSQFHPDTAIWPTDFT